MPITCRELLGFAKDCLDRNDEVGYRNAISRAYYAAYHCVYPALRYGPKDNHQGLIDYLLGDGSKGSEEYDENTLKAIGFMLQTLKDNRIIADYRLDNNFASGKRDAETAIHLSSNVQNKIIEIISKKQASMPNSN